MNERELYLEALQLPDLAARRAFLDHACGSHPALRDQVLELLQIHDSFAPRTNPGVPTERSEIDRSGPGSVLRPYLLPTTRPDSLGLLGGYEVLRVIGSGGFGIVLQAFDEGLQRMVAIKVIHPEMARTSPPRKRFLREAQAAAAVQHENVVLIHAVKEEPLPYLVMEYIDGQSLQECLDQTGPLEPAVVLVLGLQAARGLAAAHERGLVHRDIKPANLLIESGGGHRLKLTDFGLARTVDAASITQSGIIGGTPLYMSPEQVAGQPLDGRSDLFSLGSVLYAMCTGHPPFRAPNTLAVLKRVADDHPRPVRDVIPEVPAGLAAIIERLLAKKPEDRFATATEVVESLEQCQAQPEVVPAGALSGRSRRSRRGILVMATAILVAGVIIGVQSIPVGSLQTTPAADLSTLPVGQQIKAVQSRLIELNPDFKPEQMECEVENGQVWGVRFKDAKQLFDITPLKAFSNLRTLDLRETAIRDLNGVPTQSLTELWCQFRPEDHYASLKAMTKLVRLNGQPLAEVLADSETLSHLTEQEWLEEVKRLPEPMRWPQVIARLQKLNPGWDGASSRETAQIVEGKVNGYGLLNSSRLKDISPVKALPAIWFIGWDQPPGFNLDAFRGFALQIGYFSESPADITPLTGMPMKCIWLYRYQGPWDAIRTMPLEEFRASHSTLTDLRVLEKASLKVLYTENVRVKDLTPLAQMPLEFLIISQTDVTDLTPLAGCTKLKTLFMLGLNVKDVSPLAKLPIEEIHLNYDHARDFATLKAMANLRTINGQAAAEFLKNQEEKSKK